MFARNLVGDTPGATSGADCGIATDGSLAAPGAGVPGGETLPVRPTRGGLVQRACALSHVLGAPRRAG